jgi:hypothetical protein
MGRSAGRGSGLIQGWTNVCRIGGCLAGLFCGKLCPGRIGLCASCTKRVQQVSLETSSVPCRSSTCLSCSPSLPPPFLRCSQQAQLNGRELGWAPLNRLCWAIGSISGSMVEEQENRCGFKGMGECGNGWDGRDGCFVWGRMHGRWTWALLQGFASHSPQHLRSARAVLSPVSCTPCRYHCCLLAICMCIPPRASVCSSA